MYPKSNQSKFNQRIVFRWWLKKIAYFKLIKIIIKLGGKEND